MDMWKALAMALIEGIAWMMVASRLILDDTEIQIENLLSISQFI